MVKTIGFAPTQVDAKTIVSRCFQQSSPEIDPMKRAYQWKVHKKIPSAYDFFPEDGG